MSMAAEERSVRAPWALSAPALMLFVGVLLIPLAMTVMRRVFSQLFLPAPVTTAIA